MPRTSRYNVEFEVDGKRYEAIFRHHHATDPKIGIPAGVNYGGMPMSPVTKVLHVTECHLREAKSPIFVRGVANCSLKDEYQWEEGIKFAFQRCLEKSRWCAIAKLLVDGAPTGKYEVMPLDDRYGRFMAAFFREMKLKDYWPHREGDSMENKPGKAATVHAKIMEAITVGASHQRLLPVVVPHGEVPQANMHGLGHCGAD